MSVPKEGMKFWFGMYPSISFADGKCHIIPGFGNTGLFETSEGLVIFDVPIKQNALKTFNEVRKKTKKQVKYLIYSHGHFDHAFGFIPFLNEIKEKGWEMPEIIGHENCVRRFNKYKLLDQYHIWINNQQFASVNPKHNRGATVSPEDALNPTFLMIGNEAKHSFDLGGIQFYLFHDKGETDDSIWLWVPEKETICTGDLLLSSFPNVGNPYKVQRYPLDWALALDKMSEKEAKFLIPGHGKFIEGRENVKDALSITSEALNFVHSEVVKRLNEGKWFEQIYHEMMDIFPEKFRKHDILSPIYGCYRFAIHATYRLYHGWYDTGNPTDLFPAKSNDIATEFLKITDAKTYFNHAMDLFKNKDFQLALHILDIILKGKEKVNDDLYLEALILKSKILKIKAKAEPSFIAANIISNAVNQLKREIKALKQKLEK
ncbi:MAG: alkyl sulfatase dimerization domain-containing protein [Promethearchaeota archaeon]